MYIAELEFVIKQLKALEQTKWELEGTTRAIDLLLERNVVLSNLIKEETDNLKKQKLIEEQDGIVCKKGRLEKAIGKQGSIISKIDSLNGILDCYGVNYTYDLKEGIIITNNQIGGRKVTFENEVFIE